MLSHRLSTSSPLSPSFSRLPMLPRPLSISSSLSSDVVRLSSGLRVSTVVQLWPVTEEGKKKLMGEIYLDARDAAAPSSYKLRCNCRRRFKTQLKSRNARGVIGQGDRRFIQLFFPADQPLSEFHVKILIGCETLSIRLELIPGDEPFLWRSIHSHRLEMSAWEAGSVSSSSLSRTLLASSRVHSLITTTSRQGTEPPRDVRARPSSEVVAENSAPFESRPPASPAMRPARSSLRSNDQPYDRMSSSLAGALLRGLSPNGLPLRALIEGAVLPVVRRRLEGSSTEQLTMLERDVKQAAQAELIDNVPECVFVTEVAAELAGSLSAMLSPSRASAELAEPQGKQQPSSRRVSFAAEERSGEESSRRPLEEEEEEEEGKEEEEKEERGEEEEHEARSSLGNSSDAITA